MEPQQARGTARNANANSGRHFSLVGRFAMLGALWTRQLEHRAARAVSRDVARHRSPGSAEGRALHPLLSHISSNAPDTSLPGYHDGGESLDRPRSAWRSLSALATTLQAARWSVLAACWSFWVAAVSPSRLCGFRLRALCVDGTLGSQQPGLARLRQIRARLIVVQCNCSTAGAAACCVPCRDGKHDQCTHKARRGRPSDLLTPVAEHRGDVVGAQGLRQQGLSLCGGVQVLSGFAARLCNGADPAGHCSCGTATA